MRKSARAIVVLVVLASRVLADSLYEQSIARLLATGFSGEEISYLLLDAGTGEVVASRWEDADRPAPVGSLVKPFTALAYAQSHGFRYPAYTCKGGDGGCWLASGHGRIGISEAIAHSCNAYFRALAEGVRFEDVAALMGRLGGRGPRRESPSSVLAGLGEGWKMPPVEVARAYLELALRRGEPGAWELVRGMELSARHGTAGPVGRALSGATALAKTGTAPCVHARTRPGDGYTLAIYPADAPRFALLVRVHGVPGMQAAAVGGRMLRVVAEGR